MDKQKMRLGLYRKIEIARKQIPDMDEVAFRTLLRAEFGVESRKDMSVNQLSRLVQHFAGLGVTFTVPSRARKQQDVRPHSRTDWVEITDSMPFAAEKRQIAAIWRKLGYSLNSLDTRVKRAFGCLLPECIGTHHLRLYRRGQTDTTQGKPRPCTFKRGERVTRGF